MFSTDVQHQQQGSSNSNSNAVCGSRAPPPTPTQGATSSAIVNSDAFSAFLERSLGVVNLVLPESPTKTIVMDRDLPVIDLSGERDEVVRRVAASAAELGCFQVVNHGVPSQIVEKAEEECNRLFELPLEEKEGICRSLHAGSPFGFDFDDDTTTCARQESFWLQKDADQMQAFIRNIWPDGCVNFSRAVGEYSVALEKVSGEILNLLLEGLGKWVHRSNFIAQVACNNASVICITKQEGNGEGSGIIPKSGIKHSHPYILSTQYQYQYQSSDSNAYAYHVYVERSWVRVIPQPASLMVTIGDILKVWSNGEYKSVIGRAVGEKCTGTWMTLLYSPLTDATIGPIVELIDSDEKTLNYISFAFKDYASRLQKQRFVFKDPLDRYKIK